jgi:hypothetical protein
MNNVVIWDELLLTLSPARGLFLPRNSRRRVPKNVGWHTCCNLGYKKRVIIASVTYLIFPAYFLDWNKFNEHSAKKGQVRRTWMAFWSLGYFHRPRFKILENTTFQKLDVSRMPSSGMIRHMASHPRTRHCSQSPLSKLQILHSIHRLGSVDET